MFRPYMWAIFRLKFNLQIRYTSFVWCFFSGGGVEGCQSGSSSVFYRLFCWGVTVDYGGVGLLSANNIGEGN